MSDIINLSNERKVNKMSYSTISMEELIKMRNACDELIAKKENEILKRVNILKDMNNYILDVIGDEDIYEIWWTFGVPDGADDDDLLEIAENESQFNYICYQFGNIMAGFLEGM